MTFARATLMTFGTGWVVRVVYESIIDGEKRGNVQYYETNSESGARALVELLCGRTD